MAALSTHQAQALEPERRIAPHDRVAVPDGRLGKAVGFYCRLPQTVLVMFDSGDTAEYEPADLQRLG